MLSVDVHKRLSGPHEAVDIEVQFTVLAGERIALFGPSGVGKTSVLRMIAGFLKPDHGVVSMRDEIWFSSEGRKNLKTSKRNISIVFQEDALFPNMTVFGNLKFALRNGENVQKIEELIELFELKSLRDQYPNKLSGGQKQRVALARALAYQSDLILLDEPFASLDESSTQRMMELLLRAHQQYQPAIVYVSHNRSEVRALSDRILCLEKGKISNAKTPEEFELT